MLLAYVLVLQCESQELDELLGTVGRGGVQSAGLHRRQLQVVGGPGRVTDKHPARAHAILDEGGHDVDEVTGYPIALHEIHHVFGGEVGGVQTRDVEEDSFPDNVQGNHTCEQAT